MSKLSAYGRTSIKEDEFRKRLKAHADYINSGHGVGTRLILKNTIIDDMNLPNSNLELAVFTNCEFSDLSMKNSNFSACKFSDCIMINVEFDGSEFDGAYFSGSKTRKTLLRSCGLRGVYLNHCEFDDTDFSLSILKGLQVSKCLFDECDFAAAQLSSCVIMDSRFDECNFNAAEFKNANIKRSKFYSAEFDNADFSGAEIYDVHGYFFGEYPKFKALPANHDVSLFHRLYFQNEPTLKDVSQYWGIPIRKVPDGVEVCGMEVAEEIFRAGLEKTLKTIDNEFAYIEDGDEAAGDIFCEMLEKSIPQKVRSLGKYRKAAAEAKKAPAGISVSAFKKMFPDAFESVKHKLRKKTVDTDQVYKWIEEHGLVWDVSSGIWTSKQQRLSPIDNEIIQFNVDTTGLTSDPNIQNAISVIRDLSFQSGHPVIEAGKFMTIGWVRMSDFPIESVILVEEVQSDLPVVRKKMSEKEFWRQAEAQVGKGKLKYIEQALDLLEPFTARFYHDALAAIFDLAVERGRSRVEMLSYKHKTAAFGRPYPPRDVYEKLPKTMGMAKTEGIYSPLRGASKCRAPIWAINVAKANKRRSKGPFKHWSMEQGWQH